MKCLELTSKMKDQTERAVRTMIEMLLNICARTTFLLKKTSRLFIIFVVTSG